VQSVEDEPVRAVTPHRDRAVKDVLELDCESGLTAEVMHDAAVLPVEVDAIEECRGGGCPGEQRGQGESEERSEDQNSASTHEGPFRGDRSFEVGPL